VTAKKRPEDLKKRGRPTTYTDTLANLICQRTATHTVGLNILCKMYDDMPDRSTVNLWRWTHPEFSLTYAQAKLFQADLLAEECLEIADDTSEDAKCDQDGEEVCNVEFIARSRLRIDTRKWLASKLLPKQYGSHAEEQKGASDSLFEKLIDKLVTE